ncbi:MAG TPA: PA0069 family radical SAM protein [Longimicrobiales bacterium]|nr:PA0069 family radical SAM protein [Longimicrobiales bacterium]
MPGSRSLRVLGAAGPTPPEAGPGAPSPLKGRGVSWNPPNRFERLHVEPDAPAAEDDAPPGTVLLRDRTRSILAFNDSPDVGFDAGLNPYRGCGHGCVYCYARPTHEYLGFSAGLDFETKILVKERAPELLRRALSAPSWKPQVIALSGNTDAYQPVERRLGLTRRCLEVLRDFRNPVGIVTKSHLVTRDADLLAELAAHDAAAVVLSITSLRNEVQRVMEPRAATPARRLDAIRELAAAGVPVGVNVAPVVPGLTDHEIPAILEAAAEAGARFASYILLRLPHGVKDMFAGWLEQHFPDRRDKVLHRVREMRGGKLYDARYEVRGKGEGEWAEQLRALFRVTRARLGLTERPALSTASFRVPGAAQQADLFAG